MRQHSPLTGLWPPVATPFASDGRVDHQRLLVLSRRLLTEGARGLVILGTTGEANSLGLNERHAVIDAVVAGIGARRLIIGTGSCAVIDAAELTRHARDAGAAAVLLLPPFYYKPVSDDGLFAFVGDVIEQV